MEATSVDPILESSCAWQPMKESSAPASGLGGGKKLAPTVDGSMVVAGSSEVDAGVTNIMLESTADKPVVPEEQMALPLVSEGMVGHAVWPPSPLVVPPAVEEEDKVEEIEREESRPQAV